MIQIWITLIVGIVLLLAGSELLLKGSKYLAYKLRVSKLFVSMTIVALGTSLPELTVSGISIAHNDIGLATGNIVGSCVTNIFLIFGLSLITNSLLVGTTKTQKNAMILLYVTVLFIILYLSSYSSVTIAGILIGMGLIVFLLEYVSAVRGRRYEDKAHIAHYPKKLPSYTYIILYIVIGISGLVFGGSLLVDGVELISEKLAISTTFLGLTLTALATSLPELLTTVIAQFGKESKLALGNIIGSNIYNLALVGGLISFRPVQGLVKIEEFIFLFISSVSIWLLLRQYKGKVIPRVVGIGLVLFYLVYLYITSFNYYFDLLV
ncbi:sodium:calcium antiporter [Patescibacteria group bacterium]